MELVIELPLRQHSGFTLVELITVIVVPGVNAVVALGRFADLSDAAENAKVDNIFATASRYLVTLNGARYTLAGSPDNST